MAKVDRFEDLEVWKTAREVTRMVYALSNAGPFSRDFGLRDQMRRAAVSILSNTAEGFESRTPRMFIEYLGRAKASAGEPRAQAYVALDVGYLTQSEFEVLTNLVAKCGSQASNLIWYLQRRENGVAEPEEAYL